MANILVTGNAGFMGSHLADELINRKHRVVGVDNLLGGYKENINEKVYSYPWDLRNKKLVEAVISQEKPDIIYHLAAYAAEGQSFFSPCEINDINLRPMNNLLVSAVNNDVKRIVFTSSMAVYGDQYPPFGEYMQRKPVDPYGVAKAYCEQMLEIYNKAFGLEYCIIRPHNCYDKQTELLTNNGFKFFYQLTDNDYVLTLNPATNKMEYHKPTARQSYHYNGQMHHFINKGIDLLVTPDHNLFIKKNSAHPFSLISASEASKWPHLYCSEFSREGIWQGKEPDKYIVFNQEIGSNKGGTIQPKNIKQVCIIDWLLFLGWYLSEGSAFKTDNYYCVSIVQKNEENRNNIIKLLKHMGFNPYVVPNSIDIRLSSKQLYNIVKPFGHSHDKFIPNDIKQLDAKYLLILFDALMHGDGHIKNGIYIGYSTVSKQLADDVQEIAFKLGLNPNMSFEKNSTGGIYRIHFGQTTGTPWIGIDGHKVEYYDGMVYDITVPNHIFLVRRNGKVLWSGNCYGSRQNIADPYRNVLGIWMNRIMRGKPPIIYGDGEQTRAFSYIEDIVAPLVNAGFRERANKQIINLGSSEVVTVNEACKIVCDVMGYDKEPIYLDARPGEVKFAHCTIERSRDVLGYETKHTLKQGLIKMADWAKAKGATEPTYTLPLEITRNAPKPWLNRSM